MITLIALPICTFLLLVLWLSGRPKFSGWREAFLGASVLVGLFVVVTTEFLSLLNLIVLPAILCCWALLLLGAGLLCYRTLNSVNPRSLIPAVDAGGFSKALLAGIILYVVVIALIAFIAPPNTWDSLEYHMPKVVHWMQNHNIDFYPTAIPRQNHQNPGAEYFILHLQMLTGSDRFANLVEWFSMAGSLVAVSLIAGLFGAAVPVQIAAAAFAVSMPMGIMQASSTQTDYVIAFWLSCFVYFMLKLIRSKELSWEYLLPMSVALGMGVFTKATAYLYATPFLCWMVLSLFRSHRLKIIKPLAVFALILLAINSGHYIRNYDLHGNPLGPGEEPQANTKYTNDLMTPPAIISNVLRNITTHTQTPWEPVNTAIKDAVVSIHGILGLDVNDRRITWGPESIKYSIRKTMFHDEVDGNPLHLLIVLFSCLALAIRPSLRKDRSLVLYTCCVVAAFLLFAINIKWSPWNSRVHMSPFVLAAPFCAIVLASFSRKVANIAALVLLFAGIPWILNCTLRPLTGDESILRASRLNTFFNNPTGEGQEKRFLNGWNYLKDQEFKNVGLITTNSSWEYIWWVILKDHDPGVRIEHVNVPDISKRYAGDEPFASFQPEAVISLVEETTQSERLDVNGVDYTRKWHEEDVGIFLRQ